MKVYQKKNELSTGKACLLTLWFGFMFGCLYILGEAVFWGVEVFPFAWLYIIPAAAGVMYQAGRMFCLAIRRSRRPRRLGVIPREVLLEVLSK